MSRRCLHVKAEFDDKRSDAPAGRTPTGSASRPDRTPQNRSHRLTHAIEPTERPARRATRIPGHGTSRLTAQRRDHRPTRRTRHLGNRNVRRLPAPKRGRMSGELPSGSSVALCGLPDDGGSAPQQFASIVSTVRNHETRDTNVPSHRQLGERSRLSPRQNGAGRVSCRDIGRTPDPHPGTYRKSDPYG